VTNPYARPFSCPICRDFRTRTRSTRAVKGDLVPCDRCGLLSPEEYERFRRDAWVKNQIPPSICELDLTAVELALYQTMRVQNPHAAKATVLTWMEGQRYDPSKDEEFLANARQHFKQWRAR
jgi:hypothetical protein